MTTRDSKLSSVDPAALLQEIADDLEAASTNIMIPIVQWARKREGVRLLLAGVAEPTGILLVLKQVFTAVDNFIVDRATISKDVIDELLAAAEEATADTEYPYKRR